MALSSCAANPPDPLADAGYGEQIVESDLLYPPPQLDGGLIFVDSGPILFVPPPRNHALPTALPDLHLGNPASAVAHEYSSEGYRIQIYSGRDKISAKRIEGDAITRLPFSVYLTYEAPQYKVRVGDFSARDEAANTCAQLKQNGFPEAWVVRANISVQKR